MSELQFIPTDAATISGDNLERLIVAAGRDFFPGDPLRNLMLALSYVQACCAAHANYAANQSFVENASSDSLDALGMLVGVTRRAGEPARTTLRFSLGAAREEVTLVPVGTRATLQGSAVYFASIDAAEIPEGETYVDVIGEATVAGPAANGFLVGEIATLVDTPAHIATVTNTTLSSDGSAVESDASIRERIREAPTRFSVGGPEDAYIAMTKDARADVDSVSINSPDPRIIDIYFTLTGGAVPQEETITEVATYLNDKYRRPMSDVVNVQAPSLVEYTIDIAYWIATADTGRAAEIQAAVTLAVADFVIWQRASIGRDVNPSELEKRVMTAGALRVVITAPTYAELDYSELAVLDGEADINYEGIDDE